MIDKIGTIWLKFDYFILLFIQVDKIVPIPVCLVYFVTDKLGFLIFWKKK